MNDRPTMWELLGAGVAIGGTGVWALAAAARVGILRAILDVFPRGSWDAVTWVLIPALFLAPIVVQGLAVAALSGRYPWAAAVAGAVAGALIALAVIGAALLMGVRQLPKGSQAWLGRTAPEALIIGFTGAIVAGWLIVAARLARLARFRWVAVPIAAAVMAVAWMRAHHLVVALSYVFDRPEADGFFAAVTLGGAAGSAWAARPVVERPRAQPARTDGRRAARDGRDVGGSHGA